MEKILFIQPSLDGVGGVERVLPSLGVGLQDRGYKIASASFYDKPNFIPTWSTSHSSLTEVSTRNLFDKFYKIFKRCRYILRRIKVEKPDIIIISTHGSSLIGLLLKSLRLINIPVVIYVHQSLSASDKGYMFGTRWLYQYADGFVCVSKGTAQEILNLQISSRIPVVVAYNPLPARSEQIINSRLPVAIDSPILMTAARLEVVRGVDILIDVCCRYFSQYPGELWILGEGSLRVELTKKVEQSGLAHRMHFFGTVDSVEPYLKQADMYVSCARAEAFGVSLIEALSLGVPLVCTDVPYGPREIMEVFEKPSVYPYPTPYGYLIRSVKGHHSDEFEDVYNDFCTSIESLVSKKVIFDKAQLIARAQCFTIEGAVDSLVSLLQQISFKKV